jgi:hypothetical protein
VRSEVAIIEMAPNYDLTDEELTKLARLAVKAKTTAYCAFIFWLGPQIAYSRLT